MKAKELIQEELNKSPHRKANYCEDCHEYVEEPMMVCRYESRREINIFVSDKNTKKMARMLEVALRTIQCMKAANPSPDLSYHKYVEGFKFVEEQAEEGFARIEKIAEEEA